MIVLVKEALPIGVQIYQIAQEFIAREKPGVGHRLADGHPAFARGR